MKASPVDALELLSDSVCDELRARFREAAYTDQTVAAAEAIAPGLFDALRLPVVHWNLARDPAPATDLALLFAYDAALPATRARAALGDPGFDALRDAGVLALEDDLVRATFRIIPLRGLWFLADHPAAGEASVMGPGRTTLLLADTIPEVVQGAALDVGCGAGAFALLAAARGATPSVGVDISSRAIAVARFNARLNGLPVDFAAGDLLEPVRGKRFDLLVAQPPFVTRPPDLSPTTYLHGGPMGDELAVRLVGELPSVLAPGGCARVLFDSAVRPRMALHARLREALRDAPVDLLVLAAQGLSPDLQAVAYASLHEEGFGDAYAAAVLRYRRHLDTLGVKEFSHALAVVRRAPAGREVPGGRYTVTLPVRALAGLDARGLDDALAALDLAASDDATLTAACVRVARTARFVEERARPDPGLEPVLSIRFEPGGVGTDRTLTEAGLVLLGALDAAATVRDAIARYADACEADASEVAAQVVGFVREGLARGLLVPGAR